MMFVDRIDGVDGKEVKRVFKELITAYMNPAYGSMSKRDFDILLFMKLQDLKIIEKDPDLGIEIPKVYTTAKSVQTALAECEQDPNMIAMCNSLGYSSISAFVSDAGNGSLALDKTHAVSYTHVRAHET